ncbi:ABC transporter substrate-binding protein [Nocardioides yefusunii]|uniref:ABC transporter substrate-binding protein n=1 Tax=Nocardioides yefusunii TaxID=2500546 RepID=A0ABW1R0K6_9ACTN|nr:ABC transporter substrate-binding protein [Nocardioides yefusunii]
MKTFQRPTARRSGLRRATAGLAVLAATSLALTACGSDDDAEGTSLPRIATVTAYPYIPVALEQGYFADEFDTDDAPTVNPIGSANDAIAALRSGNADIAVIGFDPANLVDVEDVVILASSEISPQTTRVVVPESSKVTEISQLKGKKVASYSASPNIAVVQSLNSAGLKVADVEYVSLQNDAALSTLAGGGVDGWVTYDPSAASAEIEGVGRAIADGDDFGYLNPVFIYTTKKYLKENPEAVESTLEVYGEAIEWINANTDAAAGVVSEATGLKKEIAAQSLSHRNYALEPVEGDVVDFMERLADINIELGVSKGRPDYDAIIDNSVVSEILAD